MLWIEHFLTNKTPVLQIIYYNDPSLHPIHPTLINAGPAKMIQPDFDVVKCEGEEGSICNFQG